MARGAASPVTLDDHLMCHSHLQYAGVCVVCVYTCVSLCTHGHCNHHNRIIVPIGHVLSLSSSQEVFRFACSFNNGLVHFCCCFYWVSFKRKSVVSFGWLGCKSVGLYLIVRLGGRVKNCQVWDSVRHCECSMFKALHNVSLYWSLSSCTSFDE